MSVRSNIILLITLNKMTTEDAILNNLDLVLQRIEESLDRLEGVRPAAAQRVASQPRLSTPVTSPTINRGVSSSNLQAQSSPLLGRVSNKRIPVLEDVTKDNELYMAFFNYLSAKHLEETLEFYSSVNAYHWRVDNKLPPAQIAELGSMTFNKYVRSGAEKQISVDDMLLETITNKAAAGDWTRDLFDGALSMLKLDLSENFQAWLRVSNYRI